jgi:hypothetical protein
MHQSADQLETGVASNVAAAGLPASSRRAASDGLPQPRLRISARFLLAIYAVVPLCTLALLLDHFVWRGELVRLLPTSPERFFVFQLLFGTPHIIASSVILFSNTNYVRSYWPRLVGITVLILLFFGVGSLYLPYHFFLAFVGAATVLHVIKQQVGIGKGMCRMTSRIYDVWGWTLIAFGSILYFAIYAWRRFSPEAAWWTYATLWGLAAVALVLTVVCHTRISSRMGRMYLWSNSLLILQSGAFYGLGYSFLAILGPRLVHDVTAFTFYIVHDVNKHGQRPQNLLYRAASKLGLGIVWVCPAMAILLTWAIDRFADPVTDVLLAPTGYDLPYAASFLVVGYLGLLHYYTEAFTWKRGSEYRDYVTMTA